MALFSLKDQQNGETVVFTALDILRYLSGTELVNDEIVLDNRIYRLSTFLELTGSNGISGNNGNDGGGNNGNGAGNSQPVDLSFDGNRPISRAVNGLMGVIPASSTFKEFLEKTFYPSIPPAAQLSIEGGNEREFGASNAVNLLWTAVKNTATLTGILVNGASIAPNGSTQSGNQPATALQNVNTPFSMAVTADSVATAATTLIWKSKKYWGTTPDFLPPADAVILALSGALSTTRTGNYNGINGAGNYLVFAWPSTFGDPVFTVNGLPNTAFTKVRSASPFTNTFGYICPYDVWMSNTKQNSPITLFEIR